MSVVVRGMEYPESCAECCLWMCDDQGAMCPFKEHEYISDGDWQPPSDTERGDWCPLVELPEKHGNLIDETSLMQYFWANKHESFDGEYVVMAVMATPTIVEAEGDD